MKKVTSIVLNNFVNDARVLKEGVSLSQAGYSVRVVCLHDPGLALQEQQNGIDVFRIALKTRSLPKSTFFWILKYLEFFLKVLFRFSRTDIVHCHDLNTLSIGYFMKVFRRKVCLVYDAHEFETEQHQNPGRLMYWLSCKLESVLIRKCDAVITVSKPIAEAYAKRYSIEEPQLVLNCPPFQNPLNADKFRECFPIARDTRILLYQGGLSHERGLETSLEAFHSLKDPGLAFVLMGYGPLEEEIREFCRRDPRIFLHPAVSQADLPYYTASADFGLLFYENTCLNNYYCMPNKYFEYLMAGVPVVVSPLFELRRLTETYVLGIVAEDTTAAGMKSAMEQALVFDRQRFIERLPEFTRHYNWEHQEENLLKIYANLCAE